MSDSRQTAAACGMADATVCDVILNVHKARVTLLTLTLILIPVSNHVLAFQANLFARPRPRTVVTWPLALRPSAWAASYFLNSACSVSRGRLAAVSEAVVCPFGLTGTLSFKRAIAFSSLKRAGSSPDAKCSGLQMKVRFLSRYCHEWPKMAAYMVEDRISCVVRRLSPMISFQM